MKKEPIITQLRGLAIIFVVLGHDIIHMENINSSTPIFWQWLSFFCYVHVPLFFILSGYCYHPQKYSNYILKKIRNILIPYFFFCFLKIIYALVLDPSFAHSNSLLGEIYDVLFSSGGYWFPYCLFIIFLIFPLIEWIMKKTNPWVIFALFLAIASIVYPNEGANLPGLQFMGIYNVIVYTPYFVLGYLLRYNFNVNIKKQSLLYMIPIATLLIVGSGFLSFYWKEPDFLGFILSLFSALLKATVIFCVFKLFENSRAVKWFELPGTYSLQIMFLDSFFWVILFKIYVLAGIEYSFVLVFFTTAITVSMTIILCWYLFSRFSIFRFLTGTPVREKVFSPFIKT